MMVYVISIKLLNLFCLQQMHSLLKCDIKVDYEKRIINPAIQIDYHTELLSIF